MNDQTRKPKPVNPSAGGTYIRGEDGKPIPIEEAKSSKAKGKSKGPFSSFPKDQNSSEVSDDAT